jgi:hypothetical protein
MVTAGKPVASLRWWIGSLLFASTVINYVREWFPKPERALATALFDSGSSPSGWQYSRSPVH